MASSEPSELAGLLGQLLKVTCYMAVQGKSLSDGAPLLDRLGVDRSITAEIYGTSEGSVRAILSQARRTPKKQGR
jgi:hypothetical protein